MSISSRILKTLLPGSPLPLPSTLLPLSGSKPKPESMQSAALSPLKKRLMSVIMELIEVDARTRIMIRELLTHPLRSLSDAEIVEKVDLMSERIDEMRAEGLLSDTPVVEAQTNGLGEPENRQE